MKTYYIVTLDIQTEHLSAGEVLSAIYPGIGAKNVVSLHLEGIISLFPITAVFGNAETSDELSRLAPLIDTLLADIALGALFSAGIIYSGNSDSGCYLLTILVSTENAEITPDFCFNEPISRHGMPIIEWSGIQSSSRIPSTPDVFCLDEQGFVTFTDDRIQEVIQRHGKKMMEQNDQNAIRYLIGTT